MKLHGKVALVTGSAMGIGKEIALRLASEGANIVLFDLSNTIFDTAKEIESLGVKTLVFKGDVANRSDVEKAVNEALMKFEKIDILVNNAGIYPFKPFLEMSEEDWDRVMNVNVKGTFYFTKAIVPVMVKNNFGRIINIASIAGTVVGFPGLTHYSASKAAILGFTRALALELARFNITVNAIAPGPIETPGTKSGLTMESREMFVRAIPVGRLGLPKDIAAVVAFLASEDASFITGQLIVADGGYVIQ